jgi:hypothetical protein
MTVRLAMSQDLAWVIMRNCVGSVKADSRPDSEQASSKQK